MNYGFESIPTENILCLSTTDIHLVDFHVLRHVVNRTRVDSDDSLVPMQPTGEELPEALANTCNENRFFPSRHGAYQKMCLRSDTMV